MVETFDDGGTPAVGATIYEELFSNFGTRGGFYSNSWQLRSFQTIVSTAARLAGKRTPAGTLGEWVGWERGSERTFDFMLYLLLKSSNQCNYLPSV